MGSRANSLFLAFLTVLAPGLRGQTPVDFNRDIEPIFAARCYQCHGPKLQAGGLRLDRRANALKGGGSGIASIVPGQGATSLLVTYISGTNSKTVMPPAGDRLTAAQIEIIRAWIDEGGAYPAESNTVDFARDVRPIFESRCFSCHGPEKQTHGLRLDVRAVAMKGGDSGAPAIVPGNSASSLLISYVSGKEKVVMPAAGPRLTTYQVDTLRKWIDAGADWPDTVAGESGVVKKTDHWAFKKAVRPAVPSVKHREWVRNPIDAFVLAKLEAQGWKPNAPAGSRDLLRRMFLDLTGLPPTLGEQDEWLKNPTAATFDRLADELLARPSYGERWGRHWLDLVRYAETNGYERDAIKPQVWKYRDYVVRAFNQDKPFDQFTIEQLAGDELPELSPEKLIATGYYRLGAWDDEPADPDEDRFDQLDDIVSTTSQVYLGLTLGCARCHNHKFEPLSARDYYSMVAIFDGLQRPQDGRTELDSPIGTRAQLAAEAARDAKIEPLQKQIKQLRDDYRKHFVESGQSHLPAPFVEAFLTDPKKRNDTQNMLLSENSKKLEEEISANMTPEVRQQIDPLKQQIADLRNATPDLPRGYFMREPKPEPPPTHLLIRGKAAMPGPEVPPAVPAVLVKTQPEFQHAPATSGRRLGLARWLLSPENPLTARVIVNRIWQFHFGEGLVRTPSDFGVMGDKPTHPELLDYLATWFVDNGWSIKKLHQLILASNTYRMSKQWNDEYGAKDPENRLLWRMHYSRLEVEAILDSVLTVAGQMNPKMYGPSMYPFVPSGALEGHSDPDKIWKPFDESDASRRTIYAHVKRSMIVPLMEVMDFCDTTRSSAKRLNTAVASQALSLFNGDFVNREARHLADRLVREAGEDPAKQIYRAYRLALARLPTPSEQTAMQEFLKKESLEQMCRVILNLNEFVYPN